MWLTLRFLFSSYNTHVEVSISIAHADVALLPLSSLITTHAPNEIFVGRGTRHDLGDVKTAHIGSIHVIPESEAVWGNRNDLGRKDRIVTLLSWWTGFNVQIETCKN